MNKIISIIAILGIVIIAGCTKAEDPDNIETLGLPIASFYYTGNDGPAPVTVTFHNTSEYCDQYHWTFFANGPTSTDFEPSFTYNNGGNDDKSFLVTLKVTDASTGETNTRSKSILIHPMN